MKQTLITLGLLTVLAFAQCKSKKSTASAASPAAFEPSEQQLTAAQNRWNGTEAGELKAGQHIFVTRCNQCHEAFEITRFTEKKWLHEIDEMAPKANLTQEEKLKLTKHILSYLDSKMAVKAN